MARAAGILAAFGATLLLNACAGTGGGSAVPEASGATGQPVVFGRVLAVEKNKPLKWAAAAGSESPDGNFQVLVLAKGQNTARNHRLRGDGSFAWALAPGAYALAGYSWSRYGRRRSDRVWMDFTVPPKAEGVYVGTLKIDATQVPGTVSVSDDAATAKQALKKLAPQFKGKVAKRVMTAERLSKRVRSRRAICDASWGLPCENSYSGVVSIAPNTAKQTTPTATSLQPTLRWEPTSSSGVRYDVVVYEAMAHSGTRKLQGRVVDYAEGLTKPEHRLARALKPKTTYYWTVRLRRGDIVSNWTRYSYTAFYGIRYSRRLNNLYSFDTPG